tara:strand:- start:212 stop:559 length:348 start_codon:yes stop_codon:yes gene_type:complete
MSWAVGQDANGRDIGYGVPAVCDHPDCTKEIDRGLAYRCGEIHADDGCGLYFCNKHKLMTSEHYQSGELCERCINGQDPFKPSADAPEWVNHKMTHPSWAEWRKANKMSTESVGE